MEAKLLLINVESLLISALALISHPLKSSRHSRSPKTQPLTGLVKLITIVCKESTVLLSHLKSFWKSIPTEWKKQLKEITEKLEENLESSTCTNFLQVVHSCIPKVPTSTISSKILLKLNIELEAIRRS